MRRPIDCRLRIGSQSSDPQPTIVRTPTPRFLDWRLRRSSEHKCRGVAYVQDTRKAPYLLWLEGIAVFYVALSHQQLPMLAQPGSCFLILGENPATTHQTE